MRRASTGVAAVLAAVVMVLVGATIAAPPAASGGGSVLVPDRDHYEPGDLVHLTANVRKQDLDWYGPYTVSLRPVTAAGSIAMPGEDPADITVGRLVVTRVDPTSVRAEVTFVLPKVADGEFWIQHCNPGCTKNLGDLSGGFLQVGDPPIIPPTTAAPATTAAPVTTARPAPTAPTTRAAAPTTATVEDPAARPDERAGAEVASSTAPDGSWDELRWWLVGALALALVVGAAIALGRRTAGRRTVTATTRPGDAPDGQEVVTVDLARDPVPAAAGDEAIGVGR